MTLLDREKSPLLNQPRLSGGIPTSPESTPATTIAIASGKGGVGKTSLSVNLAATLSLQGFRVALIDFDLGMANADVLLGIQCPYNLSHVLSGTRRIEEVAETAPGDFQFIAGVSGSDRFANLSDFERQRLIGQAMDLEQNTDFVILDCGAGISRNVTTFSGAADVALLVTTPEPTALADVYAMTKVLVREQSGAEMRLVVNMCSGRTEARRVHQKLDGVSRKFLKKPIADGGYILHDISVEKAVRSRTPFVVTHPRCTASLCVGSIASWLIRRSGKPVRSGGYFRRVVGLFS